jgi:flagellar motor switch protein FliG
MIKDSILVSYIENEDPEKSILVVGKKRINQSAEIINAFSGDEATELYKRLITKREKTNE